MPIYEVWSGSKAQVSRSCPTPKLLGHWACDGQVELYWFTSTEQVLREARKEKHRVEAGKIYAQDHLRAQDRGPLGWQTRRLARPDGLRSLGKSLLVAKSSGLDSVDKGPPPLSLWRGPFSWGFDNTFPYYLDTGYPGVVPTRQRAVLGGHPVEVGDLHQGVPRRHRGPLRGRL